MPPEFARKRIDLVAGAGAIDSLWSVLHVRSTTESMPMECEEPQHHSVVVAEGEAKQARRTKKESRKQIARESTRALDGRRRCRTSIDVQGRIDRVRVAGLLIPCGVRRRRPLIDVTPAPILAAFSSRRSESLQPRPTCSSDWGRLSGAEGHDDAEGRLARPSAVSLGELEGSSSASRRLRVALAHREQIGVDARMLRDEHQDARPAIAENKSRFRSTPPNFRALRMLEKSPGRRSACCRRGFRGARSRSRARAPPRCPPARRR